MSNTTPKTYIKPCVGGIDAEGIPWTGGEPTDVTWVNTKRIRPHSNYASRGKSDFRQYSARIKGLDVKFKKVPNTGGMDFQDFKAEVQRHLEVHGMDSVFWVPNPDKDLNNIIIGHSLYSVQNVVDGIKSLQTQHDDYDQENLTDSGLFLLNSIDSDIKSMLNPYLKSDSTGPEIWIRIVHEVQSSSVERMLKVKNNLSRSRVRNFRGDDIKQFSKHIMLICRDLENGQELPKHTIILIIDMLIEVPVEKFRMEFLSIRPTIVEQMNNYHGKLPRDINKALQILNGYYTYETLLAKANLSYQTLLDLGQWGLAGTIKDRLGAPEAMFMSTEVNALSQQAVAAYKKKQNGNGSNYNNSSKPIVCYHCKKPGHRKSECKQLVNGNSKPSNSGGGFKKNGSGKRNFKKIPPHSGDPQTKTVDGIEYHWCSKCGEGGRWSPSHGTSEHTAGAPTSKYTSKPETNVASTGLSCDWDSDDWEVEANMVNIPYARRYRTLVGDNLPQDIEGLPVSRTR